MFSVKFETVKASRLLSILLLLQTHERMTSKELARRFEVSPRTILRDIEALSAAGVPVFTERGRNGAIVLDRRARLNLSRLNPVELQLISVAGVDPDLLKQVGLQAVHSSVQEKLTAATTRTHSSSTSQLSDVLLIDSSGWFTTSTERDLTGLLTAAREQRRIRLRYRRSGEPRGNWITVDPYGLVNKTNSWYLVADDNEEPRMFNTSRIENHELLADIATLRPGHDLRSVWADLLASFRPAPHIEVHALLRSTRLDLARRILGTRIADITTTSAPWTPITVHYPDIESIRQLLQFGDHIRIQSPASAVKRFYELATQIAQAHAPTN